MRKKALIIIGSIGIIYFFLSFILPNYVGIPLAAYESYKNWAEFERESSESELNEFAIESIGGIPFPIGSVSDYEKVFSENEILELTKVISDYKEKTTREIAIVSVHSIEPYDNIKDFSTDLANEWGIGNPESDNGLLILFSKNLRELRVTTGFGTEKILTDEICKKVIDETIIPKFEKSEYFDGIKKGLSKLIELWE